jgi:hypothetical protein
VRPSARSSIIAVLFLIGVFAGAQPAHAGTQIAPVSANVIKPLVLAMLQNLDLGTITLGPGTWSNATVSLSKSSVFSCANANITCTGATLVAQYNVEGSNNQTVHITAPNVTLVNQSDATQTLTLVVDAPATVVLTNSGPPGTNFNIGGSISVDSTTAAGTYAGTFNVTVNY